jgi:hypothetical protein
MREAVLVCAETFFPAHLPFPYFGGSHHLNWGLYLWLSLLTFNHTLFWVRSTKFFHSFAVRFVWRTSQDVLRPHG